MEVINIYGPALPKTSKNFYQQYQSMDLYIKSIEKTLESLNEELDNLIRQSGPQNVRAISYEPTQGVSIRLPDMQVLERIQELRAAIAINETNLKTWNRSLDELKRAVIKKAKQSESELQLKVFVAAWIEGKDNHVIASELGYSVGTIWNAKVEINRLLVVS